MAAAAAARHNGLIYSNADEIVRVPHIWIYINLIIIDFFDDQNNESWEIHSILACDDIGDNMAMCGKSSICIHTPTTTHTDFEAHANLVKNLMLWNGNSGPMLQPRLLHCNWTHQLERKFGIHCNMHRQLWDNVE